MDIPFTHSYVEARAAFLQQAQRARAPVARFTLAARGPQQEELSIDVATLGATQPHTLIVLTSGVHGVEGYAGSALQQLWLSEFAGELPAGVGALLIHGVNPFGFAHGRRVNENNVDLNRNALAQFPGPTNDGYARIDHWLNPPSAVPRFDDLLLRAAWPLMRNGMPILKQAIFGGQYEFPLGLFYGGRATEESLRIVGRVLSDAAVQAPRTVLHIDLHTGLGRRGDYEMLLDYAPQSEENAAFRRWFDPTHVVSDHPGDTTNYVAHGMVTQLIERNFTHSRTYTTVIDFGTVPPLQMLKALRAENRVFHYGCHSARRAQRIRAALRAAFYPTDAAWRDGLLQNGRAIFSQLAAALARGLDG